MPTQADLHGHDGDMWEEKYSCAFCNDTFPNYDMMRDHTAAWHAKPVDLPKDTLDEILLAPFLYGIQSDFITDKDELQHRIEAFKASRWFKEPEQAIHSLIKEARIDEWTRLGNLTPDREYVQDRISTLRGDKS